MTAAQQIKYQRQIQLIGYEAQEKLLQTSALIVGVGGLGCAASQYLVAAGIGKIYLADGDVVSEHNLHRQILFRSTDIGVKKTEAALKQLTAMNTDVEIHILSEFVNEENIINLAQNCDYIIDGTDNMFCKKILYHYCKSNKKKYIFAALYQFEGQLSLIDFGKDAVAIPALFFDEKNAIPTCESQGTLGFLPGIMGIMQAQELVKDCIGKIQDAKNYLLHYDAIKQEIYKTEW